MINMDGHTETPSKQLLDIEVCHLSTKQSTAASILKPINRRRLVIIPPSVCIMGQDRPHTSQVLADWRSKFLSTSYTERKWIRWRYYNSLYKDIKGEIKLDLLDDAFLEAGWDEDVEDVDPQQVKKDLACFNGIWRFDTATSQRPKTGKFRAFRRKLRLVGKIITTAIRLFAGRLRLFS